MVVIRTKRDLRIFVQEYKGKQKLRLKFCNCIFQPLNKRGKFTREPQDEVLQSVSKL